MADEVTTGELARRLDRFEERVDRGFTGVSDKIDSLAFVSSGTYEVGRASMQHEIDDLKDWRKFVTRTALIAVLGWAVAVALGVLSVVAR